MGDFRGPPLPPPILEDEGWRLQVYEKDTMLVCYNKTITHATGVWKAENALLNTLPTFFTQLALILTFTYLLKRLFKPLRISCLVANVLGGLIIGPSGFAFQKFSLNYIVPFGSIMTLETIANYGLIYFMFLKGLEVDLKPILHARNRVLSIAMASMVIPAPIGYALHKLLLKEAKIGAHNMLMNGSLFWGLALSTTNFSELAQLLASVKLLRSEIGRTALSITVITDFISWVLLVITMAAVNNYHLHTMLSTLAFIIVCIFVLRPAISWIVHHTNIDEHYDEHHVSLALFGAVLFGYITDSCGSHSIVGAFMLGVILPRGELKNTITEKVEYFVSEIMLPLFFLVIGMRLHHTLTGIRIVLFLAIIVLAFLAKLVVTSIAALISQMSLRDSFALGLLMNTKGVLALIILNVGRDLKVLDNQSFSIMVYAVVVMTGIIGPIMTILYESSGTSKQIQCKSIRSIQQSNSEFRVLACIHKSQNVPGIVNLLEASYPTKESPMSVFAVHLVELTSSHASAMLIVHDTCKSTVGGSRKGDDILTAFENFQNENDGTTVQALTAISSYTTMHEDIRSLSGEKDANLIIVPFHNESTLDGGVEDVNSSIRLVNSNVLHNSPCSVAVFVDRGLKSTLTESSSGNNRRHHYAMLFTGGPDDREALAYAWRMAENPNVNLTVVRIIAGEDATFDFPDKDGILKAMRDSEMQKLLDDQYIESLLINTRNQPSIKLTEKVVNNGEETIQLISSMGNDYDLCIVGRGTKVSSPLTFGLSSDWGDCPELGPMGDTLVSSSFLVNASILVVQKGTTSENNEPLRDSAHSKGAQGSFVNYRNGKADGDESDDDRL
ncbi:PREDICTED: cation/H(+) antiporter 15-like [Fragaria vesca subsp. vesca]